MISPQHKRYDIIVDYIAKLCVWEMRDCHYAIMHDKDIDIDESLQQRIDGWIQWRSKLASREDSGAVLNQEWLDYDMEGREIAAQLLPAIGADAEVYYFSEARKEYELLVMC